MINSSASTSSTVTTISYEGYTNSPDHATNSAASTSAPVPSNSSDSTLKAALPPFTSSPATSTSSPATSTSSSASTCNSSPTSTQSPGTKYRTLYTRQRKRVQRLRQALNMKKKRMVNRKTALEALHTMLPERIVNFIDSQIELHQRKNVTHLR